MLNSFLLLLRVKMQRLAGQRAHYRILLSASLDPELGGPRLHHFQTNRHLSESHIIHLTCFVISEYTTTKSTQNTIS